MICLCNCFVLKETVAGVFKNAHGHNGHVPCGQNWGVADRLLLDSCSSIRDLGSHFT